MTSNTQTISSSSSSWATSSTEESWSDSDEVELCVYSYDKEQCDSDIVPFDVDEEEQSDSDIVPFDIDIDKYWKELTRGMLKVPDFGHTSIEKPLELDLVQGDWCTDDWFINEDGDFYSKRNIVPGEKFERVQQEYIGKYSTCLSRDDINILSNHDLFVHGDCDFCEENGIVPENFGRAPRELCFSRADIVKGTQGYIAKSNSMYYTFIKSRRDTSEPEKHCFIDPSGIVLNLKSREICFPQIKSSKDLSFFQIDPTIPIKDYMFRQNANFYYYTNPKLALYDFDINRLVKGTLLNHHIPSGCNYIRVSKKDHKGAYLIIDTFAIDNHRSESDKHVDIRVVELEDFNSLTKEQFCSILLEKICLICITEKTIITLLTMLEKYYSNEKVPKLWYNIKKDTEKIKELIKKPVKYKSSCQLFDRELILTNPMPCSDEKKLTFEEELIMFLQIYSEHIADIGGVIIGRAAVFMANQDIIPPKEIEICLRSWGSFWNEFYLKRFTDRSWEIMETETRNKKDPYMDDILLLFNRKYRFHLNFIFVKMDPQQFVSKFNFNMAKVIWDPSDENGKVIGFGKTEQSAIDDILAKKAVFPTQSHNLPESSNQSIKPTENIIYRVYVCPKTNFYVSTSPDSILNLSQVDTNQNEFPNISAFNQHYVYSVDEEYKEFIDTLINIYEQEMKSKNSTSPSLVTAFIKNIVDDLRINIGANQFSCHPMTIEDACNYKLAHPTTFETNIFKAFPSEKKTAPEKPHIRTDDH